MNAGLPLRRVLFLASGLAVLGCATAGAPGGLPDDVSAVRAGYLAALEAEDLDRIGEYFTDDAELAHGASTYRGRENIVAHYFTPPLGTTRDLRLMIVRVTRPADEEVVEEGRWTGRLRGKPSAGTYLHRWTRRPETDWLLRTVVVTDDAG